MAKRNPLFALDGKIALVTGGSRGLGWGMAEALANAGAHVVLNGRTPDALQARAEGLRSAGLAASIAAFDVADTGAAKAAVESLIAEHGRIDILINNAGINPAQIELVDMTEAFWDKVMDVNVKGPMRMSTCVVPTMAAGGGGSIINVASVGAYRGSAGNAHYAASKSALVTLTQSMAAEWAPHRIRVNAISPGPFDTEMMQGGERAMPGYYERAGAGTMQGRVADPDECVGAILYLASDASSFVTGEDHVVSGGMLR